MPITLTFDLTEAGLDPNDRTRIRLSFQRFGWETIGETAYRYPPLNLAPNQPAPPEDWFNHVVPALMYMRSLIEAKAIQINNFTMDTVASTGWRQGVGPPIQPSQQMQLTPVVAQGQVILSENRLRDWLEACANATTAGGV